MNGLKYLIAVTRTESAEIYLDYFKSHGANAVVDSLCEGTASKDMREIMGLSNNNKLIFRMMLRSEVCDAVFEGLKKDLKMGGHDMGMAFTVPVDCIGGNSAKTYLAGSKPLKNKEKEEMTDTKNSLIIVIVDKGNTEYVMDAARSAGAGGGTVVKGKGTGGDIAKFFGISISVEKELVYIVTSKEKRDDIMYAIMEKVGADSKAHAIAFALPVEKTLGIKGLNGNSD